LRKGKGFGDAAQAADEHIGIEQIITHAAPSGG
jgi:hypothetical protein